jgi:O-antigen/teichoic acid export membrane protein
MFTLPATVINAVDANSTPLLLSFFLGGTVTGWFALGHRVLAIPFWLVGSSSQKVFYAEAAEARRSGRLPEVTLAVFGRLLSLALPAMAILVIAGPELFSLVFGAEWREAGVYTQWLAFRTTLTMVVFPLTPLIYLLERQATGTLFSAVQLIVRVGAVAIGGAAGDPRLAIALLGVGTGVVWVVYLVFLMSISGNGVSEVLPVVGRKVAMVLPAVAPLAIARAAGMPDVFVLGAALVSGLIAVGILFVREIPRRAEASNDERPIG